MNDSATHFYEFGPFRLDPVERQLWRASEEVQLTQKPFKLLLLLVENSGHVLDKNDLIEKIWPDAFVEENRLADNISILRKALGDDPKAPSYIRTVPGRGYRFVAEVRQVHDESFALVDQRKTHILIEEDADPAFIRPHENAAPALTAAHSLPKKWRTSLPAILIAFVLLLGVSLALLIYFRRATPNNPLLPIKSIAVLPFKPLVAAERDESLELGMADTLITRLSRIERLTVRPTNAVRQYTRLEDESIRAGRELEVDAVLDGTIQKSGDRVRVSVRLIRIEPEQTIWTEQFDEKFTDIFTVQDAISGRVGDVLISRLSAEEKTLLAKRYTNSTEAYEFYLRGRYHWSRRTAEGIKKAAEYFAQAIQKDPTYALAYAGLADSYALHPEYTNAPFHESMMKAKAASLKALEIDNNLAEAHVSLAYIKYSEWDWAGVDDEYRRGLALNPNYATGHQWYSEYLVSKGRTDEALKEIKLAQKLDPLSLIINARVGITLYYSRKYPEAIEQLRKTLEFDPDFILTHIFLYASYFETGMHQESIPHIVKGFFHPFSPEEKRRVEAALTAAYQSAGSKGLWQKALELMENAEKRDYNYPYTMAEIHMRLEDKDASFLWLQKATDIRHPGVTALKVEPAMDVLRNDSRFAELLRRVNL